MFPENWVVYEGVYEPREDSKLMVSVLEERDFTGKTVLEAGVGSGILTYTTLQQGAQFVTGVDVNPDALENTRDNLRSHGVDVNRVALLESDLFENVDGVFDVIVFNPPYVPGGDELGTTEERSWAGGEQGRETIDRFLEEFPAYLTETGEVFLLQSTKNDVERTIDRFREQGCTVEQVAEEKVPWEKLVVLHADW